MPAARTVHVFLVALDLFVYQAVRQTLGMLIVQMSLELGYTTTEKGWLMAAPSFGAIFTQLVGGQVTALLGAKWAVALSFAGISLSGLLPLCCSISLNAALALQALIGVFYGPMFPANSVLLSRWTAGAEERGFAAAQGELAISLASLGTPFACGLLEPLLGWRACLQLIGLVSAAAGVSWTLLAASTPAQCWYVDAAELALLETPQESPQKGAASLADAGERRADSAHVSCWRVLAHPAVLSLFLVHAVYNLGTLSIYSWSASYYAEVLHLSVAQSKSHLMAPHLVAIASKLLTPALGRLLRGNGVSLLGSRRLMCALGFVGVALALLAVSTLSDAPAALSTACFCVALACTGLHAEGFRANYLEVTRNHVGAVSAVGNCLSSVASMAAPLLVGSLVEASGGSWTSVWLLISATSSAAAVVFGALSTVTPVEQLLESDGAADVSKSE